MHEPIDPRDAYWFLDQHDELEEDPLAQLDPLSGQGLGFPDPLAPGPLQKWPFIQEPLPGLSIEPVPGPLELNIPDNHLEASIPLEEGMPMLDQVESHGEDMPEPMEPELFSPEGEPLLDILEADIENTTMLPEDSEASRGEMEEPPKGEPIPSGREPDFEKDGSYYGSFLEEPPLPDYGEPGFYREPKPRPWKPRPGAGTGKAGRLKPLNRSQRVNTFRKRPTRRFFNPCPLKRGGKKRHGCKGCPFLKERRCTCGAADAKDQERQEENKQ